MTMRSDFILSSACVLGLALASGGSAVAQTGALTQLPGTDACISEDGTGGDCADGVGLGGAVGVAVSSDGRNIYVASAVLARDRRAGALTQLPGTDGVMVGGQTIAASRDGRNVYVTMGSGVTAFARDRGTGALTRLPGTDGCISDDGTGGDCVDGVALNTVFSVAVSADGRNVYAASYFSNAVAVFARDRRTGALTQLPGIEACVSEGGSDECAAGIGLSNPETVAVSRDGRNVYVGSSISSAVAIFARDHRTGALTQLSGPDACISEDGGDCADGVGLTAPHGVAVSSDGRNVYVASAGGVAAFARDRRTGALTQLPGTDACIVDERFNTGDDCADGIGIGLPLSVAVSPDGRNVYVASNFSSAVTAFARDRRTGALTQLPGTAACISDDGTGGDCVDGVGLAEASGVVVSPDGRNVYVGSFGFATGGANAGVAVFARDRH
jgi:DNA-binding beta-propeller fold protein YncE